LEDAPSLLGESRSLDTKKIALNRQASPPQLPYAQEFAQGIFDAFNTSSSENVLDNMSRALNDFRARRFSYVPPINQELGRGLYGHLAIAQRNLITWHGAFSQNVNGELRFQSDTGEILSTDTIAKTAAHEFVHTEQTAIKIWRQADQLEIGPKATQEQMQELLRLNKAKHDFIEYEDPFGKRPSFWSFQSLAEYVIEARNGQFLSAENSIRADRLIEGEDKNESIVRRLGKFIALKDKAGSFIKDVDPKTPEDFANFYVRVQASPPNSLPIGLRDYVARMTEMRRQSAEVQAIPDSQVGQLYYRVFKNHAEALYLRGLILGYRPYKEILDEKEADTVGDAVKEFYSGLQRS
jgi:hypothetical protein